MYACIAIFRLGLCIVSDVNGQPLSDWLASKGNETADLEAGGDATLVRLRLIGIYFYFTIEDCFFDGLNVFLMHAGAGKRALRNVFLFCILLCTSRIVTWFFWPNHLPPVEQLYAICAIYLIILLMPTRVIFRRPAFYMSGSFRLVKLVLVILMAKMGAWQVDLSSEGCKMFHYGIRALWAAITIFVVPYVLYRVLLLDSQYWSGAYAFNKASKTLRAKPQAGFLNGSLGTPMLPSMSRESRDLLIQECETTRVRLIAWPQLDVDSKRMLGHGSTSQVFEGKLFPNSRRSMKEVAVKVTYVFDLTPDVVAAFMDEAKLLSELNHPNILTIFGVCIVPPSLCMIVELALGSLRQFLDAAVEDDFFDRSGNSMTSSQGRSSRKTTSRGVSMKRSRGLSMKIGDVIEPLAFVERDRLTMRDRLQLCLDSVQAILHLHQSGIVHSDIKSANFLVVAEPSSTAGAGADMPHYIVKVCDLEHARNSTEDAYRSEDDEFISVPTNAIWRAPELGCGLFPRPSTCASDCCKY